jgi:anti-sigma B factor antagonist
MPFVAVEEHLRIDVRHGEDRIVVGLHGELDLAGAPLLQAEIEAPAFDTAGIVVLDLEDLQFIDSAGLRVILSAHERSQEHGQGFALTRGPQQVQRLLSIAGVDEHLRIIASPDDQLV